MYEFITINTKNKNHKYYLSVPEWLETYPITAKLLNIYHIFPTVRLQKKRPLTNYVTELHRVPNRSNKNHELPETDAFVEQGLTHRNDYLTDMDKSILRECRQYGNKLLAFHKKALPDTQKPKHLREKNIQRWLGCDYIDANTLSEAWSKLGFNEQTVYKLVFGYMSETGEENPGLKKSNKVMAKYFEDLAETLDMPTEPEPEDHMDHLMWVDTEIGNQIRELHEQGVIKLKTNDLINAEEDPEEDEEYIPAENVFAMHPLYYGAEGCDDKFLTRINTADHVQLKQIKKLLLPQRKTNYYGYTYTVKAKLHYLTSSQKSQAWRYIKDREKKLVKIYEENAPEEIKIACETMREEYYKNAWNILRETELSKEELSKYEWLLTYIRYKE